MNGKKPLAMISQGMNGKSDEEILEVRNRAIDELNALGYDVLNTFYSDYSKDKAIMDANDIVNEPLWYLAKSLSDMAKCDAVYFTKCYEMYRGCVIEHIAATRYGLQTIYER